MPHGLRPILGGDSLVQYSVLRIERCLFSLSSPSSRPQDAPENGEDRSDRRQTHAWRWPFHPPPSLQWEYVPPVRVSMPSAFHPNTIATPATLHCSRVDARTHASTRQSPSMKHEGRREGVSPAFHGLSRERKGNDRGVVIPLCRLPRQGRSGPFLTVRQSCWQLCLSCWQLVRAVQRGLY